MLDSDYPMSGNLSSCRFVLDCMSLGGRLPLPVERDNRRRPDAQKVLNAYKAMAFPAEMAVLSDQQQNEDHRDSLVKEVCSIHPEP